MSDTLPWQPWPMQHLRVNRAARASDARDAQAAGGPTPASASGTQFEQLREAARAAGYAKGHASGLEEGRQAGHAAGWQDAQAKGHAAGFEKGLQAGEAKGLAQAQAQAREALEQQAAQWARLTASAQAALQQLEHAIGDDMVQLAVAIAEQVLQHEIASRAQYIQALATRLVQAQALHEGQELQIVIHPDDHDALHAILDLLAHPVRLRHDPSVARGGLLLQTPHGSIDASLQTRWQAMLDHLDLENVRGPSGPEEPGVTRIETADWMAVEARDPSGRHGPPSP